MVGKKIWREKSYKMKPLISKEDRIPSTPLKFICFFSKMHYGIILGMLLMSLILAINQNVFPYCIKSSLGFLSDIRNNKEKIIESMIFPLALLFFNLSIMIFSMRLQGILSLKFFPDFVANIRKKLYTCIITYQNSYFSHNSPGMISKKINDLASGNEKLLQIFIFSIVPTILSILISAIIFMRISIGITVGLIFWFLTHCIITIFFAKKSRLYMKNYSISHSAVGDTLNDIFVNHLSVLLFNREEHEGRVLSFQQEKEKKDVKLISLNSEKMKFVLGVLVVFFMAITMFQLVFLLSKNSISIEDFVFVTIISFNAIGLVWNLSFHINQFIKELSVCYSALSIINEEYFPGEEANKSPINVDKGEIEFYKVNFSHDNKKNILKNLTMKVGSGEKIVIKSPSGAGKTTFFNLVLGLNKPQSGKIYIDGMDISNHSLSSLRRNISVVTQRPVLFKRTIYENIQMGNQHASLLEIEKAAISAGCHDFIQKFENGYQTVLGDGGSKISGGQLQRIALARVLLKDSPIIFLDEPTSNLDQESSKYFFKELFKTCSTKTIIIAAHNDFADKYVDKIINLESYMMPSHDGSIIYE